MLLEFSVENERAFAELATLSLVASKLKEKEDGRVVGIGDVGNTKALTSAIILGKNGSGKSTFVNSMRFVSSFVSNSARESNVGENIGFEPNLLVTGLDKMPTLYRIVFSMMGTIYDFEFSHNNTQILYERMSISDKTSRFRKMYERVYSKETGYSFSFGEALTGRRTVWQASTRDNALFLSTAAQLNSEDLSLPYRWFSEYFRIADIGEEYYKDVTAKMCLGNNLRRRQVIAFLQSLDINIVDIEILEEDVDEAKMLSFFAPDFLNTIKKNMGDMLEFSKRRRVIFHRKKSDGSIAKFSLQDESTGTQALFRLAGPLFDSLQNGYCLVVDEINTSLHPVIVRYLIDLFGDLSHNKKRAQLVFTSHDTSLLSQRRMRRDQIWIIDNHPTGASLVPLSDFSVRRSEALDRGYLGGRYGGIPLVTPVLLPEDTDAS
jgi:AAA15 family ATPase/GTPase